MQPASARDMQPAISLLEKTPRLLETMLCDLPGELLHWKPAPERWSISEVLAHLATLEQLYAERALRMVAEESPALMKFDLAGAVARGEYSRGSAGEHLALFTRTRRSTLALLVDCPHPPALEPGCIRSWEASLSPKCSTNGPITISDISGKLPNSTARMRFTHTPVPS
jgi:hypothetical protein